MTRLWRNHWIAVSIIVGFNAYPAGALLSLSSPLLKVQGATSVAFPGVSFFLYDLPEFEPRFAKDLRRCERKGADFFFLERLQKHPGRVMDHRKADVSIIPCLFESFRRCTTTNHNEKPPEQDGMQRRSGEAPPPADFETIPWKKPFDSATQICLNKVMSSEPYLASGGLNHFWLVADWAMNFGATVRQRSLQNISVGRIEVVDQHTADITNRGVAPTQSRCSVIVPYASDVAYNSLTWKPQKFADWQARKMLVSYRFEIRRYVLFCGANPCPGAIDATALRHQSLELGKRLRERNVDSGIYMQRSTIDRYIKESMTAKFCLVLQGDTPSSHSFYDALAAGCIPVLVSDAWEEQANPFAYGVNSSMTRSYSVQKFVVQFSERTWFNSVDTVVDRLLEIVRNKNLARSYFDAMQDARKMLLWSLPGNHVTGLVLQSARNCAKLARF